MLATTTTTITASILCTPKVDATDAKLLDLHLASRTAEDNRTPLGIGLRQPLGQPLGLKQGSDLEDAIAAMVISLTITVVIEVVCVKPNTVAQRNCSINSCDALPTCLHGSCLVTEAVLRPPVHPNSLASLMTWKTGVLVGVSQYQLYTHPRGCCSFHSQPPVHCFKTRTSFC